MAVLTVLSLCLAFAVGTHAATVPWHYEGANGVATWKANFPGCNLTSQSPINIDTSSTSCDPMLKPFKTSHYLEPVSGLKMRMKNNGHTISTFIEGATSNVKVSGGGFADEFEAYQFHLHWGSDDSKGSEHTRNGVAYPMEVHFIHRNLKYASIPEALNNSDGLLVFGTFVEVGNTNSELFNLMDPHLNDVADYDSNKTIDAFALKHLFPHHPERYYHYNGSLTTPGCQESVLWHVLHHTLTVTAATLAKFRDLKSDSNSVNAVKIVNNFRPVQSLNGRIVKQSFHGTSMEVGCKAVAWHYSGSLGPQNWKDSYQKCGLARQSPTDIVAANVQYNSSLGDFVMTGYEAPVANLNLILRNNGHSLSILLDGPTDDVTVTRNGYSNNFEAYQFHFHWGSTDTQGSEHTVESKASPMELHFIHRNKKYSDIPTALNNGDGLLVFGSLVEIHTSNSPVFDHLEAHMDDVKQPLSSKTIPAFALKDLFPLHPNKYFFYEGSLTTPQCQEAVQWHLFYNRLSITQATLNKFRKMIGEDTMLEPKYIYDNYRPVQPLNSRIVMQSFDSGSSSVAAQVTIVSVFGLLTALILA